VSECLQRKRQLEHHPIPKRAYSSPLLDNSEQLSKLCKFRLEQHEEYDTMTLYITDPMQRQRMEILFNDMQIPEGREWKNGDRVFTEI
jgi:hypothetical protein